MSEVLSLPAKLSKVQNPDVGASKFCPGCGHGIILKTLATAIEELKLEDKAVFGCDIGCSLLSWNYFNIDTVQTHHGRTTPVMYGISRATPDAVAIAYMGDGGGLAIGAQHLVNAAVRNEKMLVLLCNNTNYGMTGGQMAPTTLPGQKTETSPYGRDVELTGKPAKGAEMVSAIVDTDRAYVARGSVSNLRQLKTYFKKALTTVNENNSFAYLEVLSLCPLNWRTNNVDTWARLETMEEFFPVGELVVPQLVEGVK